MRTDCLSSILLGILAFSPSVILGATQDQKNTAILSALKYDYNSTWSYLATTPKVMNSVFEAAKKDQKVWNQLIENKFIKNLIISESLIYGNIWDQLIQNGDVDKKIRENENVNEALENYENLADESNTLDLLNEIEKTEDVMNEMVSTAIKSPEIWGELIKKDIIKDSIIIRIQEVQSIWDTLIKNEDLKKVVLDTAEKNESIFSLLLKDTDVNDAINNPYYNDKNRHTWRQLEKAREYVEGESNLQYLNENYKEKINEICERDAFDSARVYCDAMQDYILNITVPDPFGAMGPTPINYPGSFRHHIPRIAPPKHLLASLKKLRDSLPKNQSAVCDIDGNVHPLGAPNAKESAYSFSSIATLYNHIANAGKNYKANKDNKANKELDNDTKVVIKNLVNDDRLPKKIQEEWKKELSNYPPNYIRLEDLAKRSLDNLRRKPWNSFHWVVLETIKDRVKNLHTIAKQAEDNAKNQGQSLQQSKVTGAAAAAESDDNLTDEQLETLKNMCSAGVASRSVCIDIQLKLYKRDVDTNNAKKFVARRRDADNDPPTADELEKLEKLIGDLMTELGRKDALRVAKDNGEIIKRDIGGLEEMVNLHNGLIDLVENHYTASPPNLPGVENKSAFDAQNRLANLAGVSERIRKEWSDLLTAAQNDSNQGKQINGSKLAEMVNTHFLPTILFSKLKNAPTQAEIAAVVPSSATLDVLCVNSEDEEEFLYEAHSKIERTEDPSGQSDWPCTFDKKKWPSQNKADCFRAINSATIASFYEKVITERPIPTEREKLAKAIPKEFVKAIGAEEVKACKSAGCLSVLGGIMQYQNKVINNSSFNSITGDQIALLIDERQNAFPDTNARDRVHFTALLSEERLKTFGPLIVDLFGPDAQYLNDSVTKSILSNPATCSYLNGIALASILNSNVKSKALTAECLKNASLLMTTTSNINSSINKDALKLTNRCANRNFTAALKKDMLEKYAASVPDSRYPGWRLRFENIKDDSNMAGLTTHLLLGKLNKGNAGNLFGTDPTKSKAKKISDAILSDISAENVVSALSNLDPVDIQGFKPALIQSIVSKYAYACTRLPAAGIYQKIKFDTPESVECFYNMSRQAQAIAFAQAASMPDDILKRLDADSFNGWTISNEMKNVCAKSDSDCIGVGVLNIPSSRSNYAAIIRNFSVDPEGKSACEDLGSIEDIAAAKNFANHVTAKCFNAEKREFTDGMKDIERLKMLKPYHEIRKDRKLLEKLTADQFKSLVTGGAFCPFVEEDIWRLVPVPSMKNMNSSCMADLQIHDRLSKDMIDVFPDNVFEEMSSDRINSDMLMMMRPEHVSHACVKVSDASKNNIGAIITKEHIRGFSVEKTAAITGEQWKEVRAESFQELDSKKLEALNPNALVHWNVDQTKAAPTAIWSSLKVEQAKEIGNSVAPERAPHAYLLSLNEITDPAVRSALERGAPVTATEGINWTLWIIITSVVVGILIIGGAVYFLMSR